MMDNVQKTVPASPSTPKSTKRNLSSSSISASQNDKKTKVYVTPNRFTRLATNDINDVATTTPFINLKEDPVYRLALNETRDLQLHLSMLRTLKTTPLSIRY
jgi:hypothetical protein